MKLSLLGWMAGVVDGEGSVSIDRPRSERPYHGGTVTLCIVNTNSAILQPFVQWWGGRIRVHGRKTNRHKASLTWRVYGKRAAKVLRVLSPYLHAKKAHAKVAIDFVSTSAGRGGRSLRLSLKVIEKRRKLRLRLLALNRRGPRRRDTLEEATA